MSLRNWIVVALTLMLTLALIARPAHADWKEPKDEKFSEPDFLSYMAAASDWADQNAKIEQALAAAKTPAERDAAVKDLDTQRKACIERQNLTVPQFHWLAARADEAWGIASLEDSFAKSEGVLQQRMKENAQAIANARADLAAYQEAEKNGVRHLTPEDRDSAIKDAQDDQKQAMDDLKEYMREAKTADDEAVGHDQDADAAMKLALSPPTDVSEADRDSYVAGKHREASDARDSAKDARARENEAITAEADAQSRVDRDGLRILHPELPASDDDKANVKAEDDAGMLLAQAEIDRCTANAAEMKDLDATLKKNGDAVASNAPAENVAILRKYAAKYSQLMQKTTTTQPATGK